MIEGVAAAQTRWYPSRRGNRHRLLEQPAFLHRDPVEVDLIHWDTSCDIQDNWIAGDILGFVIRPFVPVFYSQVSLYLERHLMRVSPLVDHLNEEVPVSGVELEARVTGVAS